jgi:hypothetical protein
LLTAGKRFQLCPTAGVLYRQWSTQTVWRKNPMQTHERWLAIIEAAEQHLQQRGALTERRRDAIALSRLRCARSIYQYEPARAREVAKLAKRNHPRLSLMGSKDFPRSYCWAHQLVGFGLAERIAEFTRPLKRQGDAQVRSAKPRADRSPSDLPSETAGVVT